MKTAPANTGMRLERLEGWLREDPVNPLLLADTCDAALDEGAHERARTLVERARALGLDQRPWTLRLARACLAARDAPRARELLQAALAEGLDAALVDHGLAVLAFREGRWHACRDLLMPWLARGCAASGDVRPAIQALWLRASHHLQKLDEAWAWVEQVRIDGTLAAEVQGIAALIAVDGGRFADARVLADAALAARDDHPDALVARACVALAEGDGATAERLLDRALQAAPDDGRILGTLGLAHLHTGRLVDAQAALAQAVAGSMAAHIGTWHALGWTHLLQGDRAAATEAFAQALALDGNFAESHGAMGLVLALGGNPDRAQHHLAVALRLDPRNVTGRYAQALLQGEAGRDRLQALAAHLLDRPGLFGGTLADAVRRATSPGPSAG
jgi:tetratricopeptide (TPR) repeat protein